MQNKYNLNNENLVYSDIILKLIFFLLLDEIYCQNISFIYIKFKNYYYTYKY
jgi:hypothetical protein